MKQSRFDYEYRSNASKRHKLVGDLLRNSIYFQNYQAYQEWPVNKVNPSYASGREHFDWVIPSLKFVIEIMGEQHINPVCFGGISLEEATIKFKEQKIRDAQKEQAATEAGWTYLAIWPKDIITAEWVLEQYREFFNTKKPVSPTKLNDWAGKYKHAKEVYNASPRAIDDKEHAAEMRKEQYQKMKQFKKQLKDKKNV